MGRRLLPGHFKFGNHRTFPFINWMKNDISGSCYSQDDNLFTDITVTFTATFIIYPRKTNKNLPRVFKNQ